MAKAKVGDTVYLKSAPGFPFRVYDVLTEPSSLPDVSYDRYTLAGFDMSRKQFIRVEANEEEVALVVPDDSNLENGDIAE